MDKAVVVQCRKIKWHKNPISGHEWAEYIPIKRWRIIGGTALGTEYRSEKEAQEMADFINKHRANV